ncbi:MAG: archaemetzincin family Zn-dependent metalloprotease [Candidatus Bathyarchaeia archaeon]
MRLRPPDQEKNASSKLKIMILPVGQVDMDTLNTIRNGLASAIPESACDITKDGLQIPEGAYNPIRHQYKSGIILAAVYGYAERSDAKRVLGVTNVDLYVPKLNFVFGEAQYLGKAALISLHRLRPEFYGQQPNLALFKERAVKEAIHEIGHTLGLGHCRDPLCIMFFSNSILDTDRKRPVFCRSCHPLLLRRLESV